MFVNVLILVFFAVIFLSASIKTAREDERLVVFRLGRLLGIRGPGLVFIVPIVDRVVRVNLGTSIPGWQALSKQHLDEKVKASVLQEP